MQLERLDRHVIVCASAASGNALARDLRAGGTSFVIIELTRPSSNKPVISASCVCRADATDAGVLREPA